MSTESSVWWWSLSTWRLLSIGCVMTFITHFPAAFMNTSTNTAVHSIEQYFNESYVERGKGLTFTQLSVLKSLMNSEWYAGQMLGSFVAPWLCDGSGRKVAYVIAAIGMTCSIGLQAIAVNTVYPELFLVGRFITALFSPISDTSLVLYLQEIAPTNLRGTLSSLYSTGYAIMCLAGMTMGHEDVLGANLRRLFVFPVIACGVATLFTLLIPETPKYLMSKRKDDGAAQKSLRFFQGNSSKQAAYVEEIKNENEENESEQGGMMIVLRTRRLRKALFLSLLSVLLTFPFFTLLQSSTHYFKCVGVKGSTAQTASSLLMVLLTVTAIVSTSVIDRFPRKTLLLSAGLFVCVSLCVFVAAALFSLPSLAIASVFVLIFAYGFGLGPIVWTLGPELVPTAHRSGVFCLMFAAMNALIVATNFLSLTLFDAIGPLTWIPLFILPSLAATAVLYAHLPETSAKETSQIYAELKHGPNRAKPVDNCVEFRKI